jgi:hypothetical protein
VTTGIRISLIALLLGALAILAAFLWEGGSSTALISSVLAPAITTSEEKPLTGEYMEVIAGCDHAYAGECVTAHVEPNASSSVALQMRVGMVLKVATTTATDDTGNAWRKIIFDEWIRYSGRIGTELWVRESDVRIHTERIHDDLDETIAPPLTTKRILVDRSEQMLYAYDGEELIFSYPVSTGLPSTPTPRGEFRIYKKVPSRYMQGPLPGISSQYYDLPGVPWDLYFTKEGGTIHGAYWHDSFGEAWSHGCVNLTPESAKAVYDWAPVGTRVTVRD